MDLRLQKAYLSSALVQSLLPQVPREKRVSSFLPLNKESSTPCRSKAQQPPPRGGCDGSSPGSLSQQGHLPQLMQEGLV